MFGFLDILKLVSAHKHPAPRCGNGNHDPSCKSHEVICRVIGKGTKKYCLCLHAKV